MLSKLFRSKSAHPLADPRRAERLAAAVGASANPLEAAGVAGDWLEAAATDDALEMAELVRIGHLAHAAGEEAVSVLSQQCADVGAGPPGEHDQALATIVRFHAGAAACFHAALARTGPATHAERARAAVCALRSAAGQLKWLHAGREAVDAAFWKRAYRVYALAERLGLASSRTQVFAADDRTSTPLQEFGRLVALAIASPASLRVGDLQALDDLLSAAASGFTVGPRALPEATHWLDLAVAEPPARLARAPRPAATVRYFCAADAMEFLHRLAARIDERDGLPGEFRRSVDYDAALARCMIDHLRRYCSIDAAMRKGPRHRLDARLEVVWGLDEILDRLQPDRSLAFLPAATDEWLMEDAGAGGVKAVVSGAPRGWLRIGALVAVRAQAAAGWQVGVVRRLLRARPDRTEIAMLMPSRDATPVALQPEADGPTDFGLLLDGRRARTGLMVVARPGAVRDGPFRVVRGGTTLSLVPVGRETGPGYQIVHCEEADARAA
jgi:hypothetical protein